MSYILFDKNDQPIEFEQETWKEKAVYAENQVKNLILETDFLQEQNTELKNLAYSDEWINDSDIEGTTYSQVTHKDKNKTLQKKLNTAKEIRLLLCRNRQH